jgi:hypothetical protein
MPYDTQQVGLAARLIEGVARRLAVDRQALIGAGVLGIPAVQDLIQVRWTDADEHRAQHAAAGGPVATLPIATAKACPCLLAQVLGPLADRLAAAQPAENRRGGDREH